MQNQFYRYKTVWLLAPIFGIILFVILYLAATFLYPGGSQADKTSTGFSWIHNYWCNLLNDYAINGKRNPAKPIALSGMFILCLSFSFFWFFFPRYIKIGWLNKIIIRASGIIAMLTTALLLTKQNHDFVTNIASFFGIIATTGTIIGLYQNQWYHLFVFGLFNILIIGLNNYLYYNPELIIYLPVVQKISFLSFLIWVCCINIHLYRKPISVAAGHVP